METHHHESPENPFSSLGSTYSTFDGKNLTSKVELTSFHTAAHTSFRNYVFGDNFPCVAAKTAIRMGHYGFAAYEDMADPKTAQAICHDLFRFKKEFQIREAVKAERVTYATFIAAFEKPHRAQELELVESLFWLYGNMHKIDELHGFDWAKGVSSDVESPKFSFSSGGDSFSTSLLHPNASSPARRAPITFLVFTPHELFELLRKKGIFARLRNKIRRLQSWIHPLLADYGQGPEFDQYALVDPNLQTSANAIRAKVLGVCPFHTSNSQPQHP